MRQQSIPLSKRPGDIVILAFFLINILFITYIVDLEQIVIANPYHFSYPIWPPPLAVDLIHWWGRNFDPALMARPVWWQVTIWIDNIVFGPFYIVAIYAYAKGKEWIRIPSIIYGSMLLTIILVILGEERYGIHAAPQFFIVFFANLPWLVFPLYIIYRMWRYPNPFTRVVSSDNVGVYSQGSEQASPSGGM